MVLLVLLAVAVAAVLGGSAVLAAWPALAVGAALLYCLDRTARRPVRTVVAGLTVVIAVGYSLGPWTLSPGSTAAVCWFVGPLILAALVVLAHGGPRRIKARRTRAEAYRRRLRADAAAARRQSRRDGIRRRTGLDVDLLAGAVVHRSGHWARRGGERITRRLERNRRRRPAGDGSTRWLDLDHDVTADLSRTQGQEILRLADALDRTRSQPH